MFLDNGLEQSSNLLVRLLQDILVVEPNSLLIGKLSTCLRTFGNIEQRNQFVKRKQLLFCSWVPSQQGQEIDDCLREIAVLTITARGLSRLRILPQQREYGESQAVAITLRQLTLSIRLQQ